MSITERTGTDRYDGSTTAGTAKEEGLGPAYPALCPNLEVAGVRAYPALMDNTFKIELVNDNEYAVRSEAEGQSVESLFRIDPDYLDRIGLGKADGKRVVEETARFLAEHQPVIDFPPMIDLEDISAAYEDYPQQLRSRLGME
jgi:hypothetical protein